MLALLEEVLIEGQRRGYGLTRIWANMEWALKDLPGVDDIIEYEARANYVLPNITMRWSVATTSAALARRSSWIYCALIRRSSSVEFCKRIRSISRRIGSSRN
jgi:MEDS: MEthanogen/methylotroph, DcmR Sensory domain